MHFYTWEMCMLMEMVFCCTAWRTRSRGWNIKSTTLFFHGILMWWLCFWTKFKRCSTTWSTRRNQILIPSCHEFWWIFNFFLPCPSNFVVISYLLVGSTAKFPSATNLGMPPTTLIVLKNTWHKCKRLSVFSLVIDATIFKKKSSLRR